MVYGVLVLSVICLGDGGLIAACIASSGRDPKFNTRKALGIASIVCSNQCLCSAVFSIALFRGGKLPLFYELWKKLDAENTLSEVCRRRLLIGKCLFTVITLRSHSEILSPTFLASTSYPADIAKFFHLSPHWNIVIAVEFGLGSIALGATISIFAATVYMVAMQAKEFAAEIGSSTAAAKDADDAPLHLIAR